MMLSYPRSRCVPQLIIYIYIFLSRQSSLNSKYCRRVSVCPHLPSLPWETIYTCCLRNIVYFGTQRFKLNPLWNAFVPHSKLLLEQCILTACILEHHGLVANKNKISTNFAKILKFQFVEYVEIFVLKPLPFFSASNSGYSSNAWISCGILVN